MSKFFLTIFVFLTCLIPELYGAYATNYYYGNGLPGQAYQPRPYRQNGRVYYENTYSYPGFPGRYMNYYGPGPGYAPGYGNPYAQPKVYRDPYGRKVLR